MSEKTFTCANCGGTFDKAWSDEESDAEAERLFGVKDAHSKLGDGDMAIVCDDCWKAMGLDSLKCIV
jgi:hypothetical protein